MIMLLTPPWVDMTTKVVRRIVDRYVVRALVVPASN
jgi:hypothetical protein